jgi:hypothetical protein
MLRRCLVWPVLLVIVAGGMLLRLWHLNQRSLWFDEAFSWRLIQFPLPEMLWRAGHDNNPPLYYILLQAWVSLCGDSLFFLRLPSVLLGAAAILGVFFLVRVAFNDQGFDRDGRALLASALVAVSVFQVRYAWEARAYALGTALAAWSSWALWRALCRPESCWRDWVLYGLLALLFAYTHPYALFSLASQGAFVAGWLLVQADWNLIAVARAPGFRRGVLTAVFVGAAWLPWLPAFLNQRAQVQANYWAGPIDRWSLTRIVWGMFAGPPNAPQPEPPLPSELLIVFDVCVLVVLGAWRKARAGEWLLLCMAVVPFALSVLASEMGTRTLSLRYFIFAHLSLLTLGAVLLWRIPWIAARWLAGGVAVAAALVVTLSFVAKVRLEATPGMQGAVAYLTRERRQEEIIVACSPLWYQPLRYHARGQGGVYLIDTGESLPHYLGTAVIVPEDFLSQTDLARGKCVWAVNGEGGCWGELRVRLPKGWKVTCRKHFAEALDLGTIVVERYERADVMVPTSGGAALPSTSRGTTSHKRSEP